MAPLHALGAIRAEGIVEWVEVLREGAAFTCRLAFSGCHMHSRASLLSTIAKKRVQRRVD